MNGLAYCKCGNVYCPEAFPKTCPNCFSPTVPAHHLSNAIGKDIAERQECPPRMLQWLRELAERVETLEQRERQRTAYELEQAEWDI